MLAFAVGSCQEGGRDRLVVARGAISLETGEWKRAARRICVTMDGVEVTPSSVAGTMTASTMSASWNEDEVLEEITPTWDVGTVVMSRYRLVERIGKGGMGEVWRATDQVVGQDVAVKFLVGVIDPESRHRFSAEVRAMARLDHPHIVSVLDQGEHDAAPLFVMTRLAGLPLGRWLRLAQWENALVAFDQVLDALAYAHARGLIHRDLKPSNIIVTGVPDQPHAVVLDFGIAINPQSDGLYTGEIVGSPGYMAPEQRRGETWRARASTDLYAFGVLLYEAVSGRSPFGKGAKRPEALESPSFLFPRAKFPLKPRGGYEHIAEEIEPLLRRLLSFRISDRPLLASDVREELSRAVERARLEQQRPEAEVPWEERAEEEEEEEERTELLSPWHPVYLAPRKATTKLPPGVYSLYGLRQPPVLGRDEELRLMWRAARRAFAGGKPWVVFLEGINGIGKSHLARHLSERANEQGLARFIEVTYLPRAPAASGMVPCLEQVLRLREAVDREGARTRLDAWLADEGAPDEVLSRALVDLLRPVGQGQHIGPSMKSHSFLGVLRAMCQQRAVIVQIHDIQFCQDESALYLLDELLQHDALPVLALATVRVDEQSAEFAQEYEAIRDQVRVERITLGPLPEGAVRSLLRSYVTLEPELEDLLVERSEGLPLLASQLLDDLLRGGALEDGPSGARLKRDEVLEALPEGIRSFWAGRIERVAGEDEEGPYWVDALQGLALSRVELSRPVIRAAGEALGEPLDDAVAAWEREGLLIEGPDERVRFCHSELSREVAAKVSPEAAVRWHIIWAAALGRLEEGGRGRFGLERGLHLIDAGEPEKALMALLDSAERAHTRGDTHRTQTAARQAESLARKLRDPIRLAWALRWHGGAALAAGRVDEADKLLDRARQTFERERVLVGLGATLEALATSRVSRAAYLPAVELCTIAVEAFRRVQGEAGLSMVLGTMGTALTRLGRSSEARAVLREAEDVARRAGDARALASALQGRGECAWYQGDLDQAEEAFAAGLEIAERAWRAAVPSLYDGLGLVALARGDFDEARSYLERAIDRARVEGQRRLEVLYAADLAAVALLGGDDIAAMAHLDEVEQGLSRLDRIDDHMQRSLEMTLTPANARRRPDLVERAGELTARLWERLGRSEEATRVRDDLLELGYGATRKS